MNDVVVDWIFVVRCIVPFIAAHLFAMVLIYFTLVRRKFPKEYPFYAIFLMTFIFYLCGPLLNTLPITEAKPWLHYGRNILLFSLGIPSLLVALFQQSKLTFNKSLLCIPYIVGITWSVFYLWVINEIVAKPVLSGSIPPTRVAHEWLSASYIYNSQIIAVFILLIGPSIYLLKHTNKNRTKAYLYGVLSLGFFIVIGNAFREWGIYYTGSSISALIWGGAVFNDIKKNQNKLEQHFNHEKALASAQFSAANSAVTISDFYPAKLDENYPFRERESLLTALKTASSGIITSSTSALLTELESFCRGNIDMYKARVREVLFLLTDTIIFAGVSANELVNRLEIKGHEINRCEHHHEINKLLITEAHYLCKLSAQTPLLSTNNNLADKVKKHILAHYHEELAIDKIADSLAISSSHLMKSFKQETKQTVNQYLVDVRINKAKNFLLFKSITETAFEVGFNNSNYFSTVFKKQTGMTPKQYQQSAKT